MGVYLSKYWGGGLLVWDGSLLSASSNVFLTSGMCSILMFYGVMLSNNIKSLLFVTSARSLLSMFMRALWSVKISITFLPHLCRSDFFVMSRLRQLVLAQRLSSFFLLGV